MEVLWLIIGVIIGLLIAWWFLSSRHKAQMAEKDAEVASARHKIEQDVELERRAHDTTRSDLANAEARTKSAEDRAAALEADLTSVRSELDSQKSNQAEAADQLSKARADVTDLNAKLDEAKRSNAALASQLEDAAAARENELGETRAQLSALQDRVRAQDSEIESLQSQLKDRQSSDGQTQDVRPTEDGGTTDHPTFQPVPQTDVTAAESSGTTDEPAVQDGPLPDAASDDLTRIKGIGRVLEGKLQGLGISTFQQIAEFTQADIDRINEVLDFPGRIEREKWVEQARTFVSGA